MNRRLQKLGVLTLALATLAGFASGAAGVEEPPPATDLPVIAVDLSENLPEGLVTPGASCAESLRLLIKQGLDIIDAQVLAGGIAYTAHRAQRYGQSTAAAVLLCGAAEK